MKLTRCQKSKKFSISGLTETEMIELYGEVGYDLKIKIARILIESTDEDQCFEEYGCNPEDFWKRVGIEL